MLAEILVPDPDQFELQDVVIEDDLITLTIKALRSAAVCPDCQQESRRVHSRYWRAVADLPCAERRVQLRLAVRRFFCDHELCERKTFAERFPDVVAPYARRTRRLAARQRRVGLALGGEAGAQVLSEMIAPTSGDTVLRLIRDAPAEDAPTPRVLGIDDWAWCKGQRYGTILVDLECRCPVDLLPDRSAVTIAAWLQAHPGVEIVSRDRSREYSKGITQGAPDAIQVADRWHLLRNLRDFLIRLLEQHRACLYAAAAEPDAEPEPAPQPVISIKTETADDPPLTRIEQRQQAVRERRLARYQAVLKLHQEGVKIRAIARQLGMGRPTVRRYIRAGGFPETARRLKRPSILDPYRSYLEQRWAAGCRNGMQLYREIREQGYTGSRPSVSRWAAQMRRQDPAPKRIGKKPAKRKKKAKRPWSARYAVWLLLQDPATLTDRKRAALTRMLETSPVLRRVYNFAQAFVRIVRHRLSKALLPWLAAVTEHQIPELSNFAQSLRHDQSAVLAALTLPWSNGQTEGQITRLKLIKRQMYGRAKFDLLRRRVLARAGP